VKEPALNHPPHSPTNGSGLIESVYPAPMPGADVSLIKRASPRTALTCRGKSLDNKESSDLFSAHLLVG
jgi:hypothetical protein